MRHSHCNTFRCQRKLWNRENYAPTTTTCAIVLVYAMLACKIVAKYLATPRGLHDAARLYCPKLRGRLPPSCATPAARPALDPELARIIAGAGMNLCAPPAVQRRSAGLWLPQHERMIVSHARVGLQLWAEERAG